jgi:hypothetical protein
MAKPYQVLVMRVKFSDNPGAAQLYKAALHIGALDFSTASAQAGVP